MTVITIFTISSSIIAAIGFARAVQYPGRRSWPWWFLSVLAFRAAVVNAIPLAPILVYFFAKKQ